MPLLSKHVISNYFRSECQKRLRLDLTPDTQAYQQERQAQGMPARDLSRPGFHVLSAAGEEWEEAKIRDLEQALGLSSLLGTRRQTSSGMYVFSDTPLLNLINQAVQGSFLIQSSYEVGNSFENGLGVSSYRLNYNLAYRALRPDLIQVLEPGSSTQAIQPDGSTFDVPEGDLRLPLRIIDIKLTAEPSVPYQIEVTYYAMALAGWLIDQGLDSRFIVAPQVAIWPGSHDASALIRLQRERQSQGTTATTTELLEAFDQDLEEVVFNAIASRLRRFFQEDLERVLNTPWQQLEWHVDNRCVGCDYLGYPWSNATMDQNHCWSMAQAQDHLSRVAFVSRGARGTLEDLQISTVSALASTHHTNPVYSTHHTLRAARTVIAGRAQALATGQATIPLQAGTSAVMPKWSDLRIYLTADFDIGSGITIAFGFMATWGVSQTRVQPGQQHSRFWQPQTFPVDQRDLVTERREFFHFLETINGVRQFASQAAQHATIQVYIWDNLTYDHLVRVIGRHLAEIIQNRNLAHLAWLFPPETLVANPDLSDRQCPITIIREVIRAVVAAPVPHYYSLLNIAREYHSSRTQPPYNQFRTPLLFEDPLTDQIPSERAHEIWSRTTGRRPWHVQLRELERTVQVKLSALESITQRLGEDLNNQLRNTAPKIADLRPPQLPSRMADDARLWFVFARLNEALEKLEVQKIRAMPPHEREARFKSALLPRRLSGQVEQKILAQYNLQSTPNRFVYELSIHSREVRAREGDYHFALAPVDQPAFLEEKLRNIAGELINSIPSVRNEWLPMEYITQATIVAIDRDHGHIVIDLDNNWATAILALENAGIIDFSQDVMLDPVHRDYFISRLESTLNAIGNPPIAVSQAAVNQALGRTRRPQQGAASPVSEVYWNAPPLYQAPVSRVLPPVRSLLTTNNVNLNQSQWDAWEQALSYRLRLIWGPPGTGKSKTLRAIILGALHEAAQQRRNIRILITGPTYEAIDNVLLDIYGILTGTSPLSLPEVSVFRLRSTTRLPNPQVPISIDVPTDSGNQLFIQLQQQLQNRQGLTLVSATVHQAYKLLSSVGSPVQEFFDFIVVDEASQLDVASSTLALAGLAQGGSVVVAGDPKQLPPIHKAESPLNLEYMVGPIFSYLQSRFNLSPSVLETNYRSSRTFIEIAYAADYPRALHSYSPELRLDFVSQLPSGVNAPPNWPQNLYWTPEWVSLLNTSQRAVCFVYREGRSSQWNPFEADAIVSLIWLLTNRLGDQLLNECDPLTDAFKTTTGQPYSMQDLWQKGVGIVTPHRAQQALIVSRLQSLFPEVNGQYIRGAVDTVERFQGQQRDIILATFALGDPDAISDEDEFLLSLNRFNVMASRARAKLIVFISQEVVNHLSSDIAVLHDSALLKTFVETFCNQSRPMILGYQRANTMLPVQGHLRWRV